MKTRLPIGIAILIAFGVSAYFAYQASQLYVFRAGNGDSGTYNLLFDSAALLLPIALCLGIFLGTLNYKVKKERFINGKVERHDELFFTQHWTNALGIVTLIITGFALGTLFIPRLITGVEAVAFAMNMHFMGIIFFFFGASFYITRVILTGEWKTMMPRKGDLRGALLHYKALLTRKKGPKEEKFLFIERLVYPAWIIGISGITITGTVKILAHYMSLPAGLMGVMTFFHGVFAIFMFLLVLGHASMSVITSFPLFVSMLTGKVTEEYVKKHHELWYEQIKAQENTPDESEEILPDMKKDAENPLIG